MAPAFSMGLMAAGDAAAIQVAVIWAQGSS
jgi:hypothetical protein